MPVAWDDHLDISHPGFYWGQVRNCTDPGENLWIKIRVFPVFSVLDKLIHVESHIEENHLIAYLDCVHVHAHIIMAAKNNVFDHLMVFLLLV